MIFNYINNNNNKLNKLKTSMGKKIKESEKSIDDRSSICSDNTISEIENEEENIEEDEEIQENEDICEDEIESEENEDEKQINNEEEKTKTIIKQKKHKNRTFRNENYMFENINIEQLRETSMNNIKKKFKNWKNIEVNMFNYSVSKYLEKYSEPKIKKSQLNTIEFKIIYTNTLYEILNFTNSNENIVNYLKQKYISYNSHSFDNDKIEDNKEVFYLTHPSQISEGVYACSKCKNKKIFMYQLQTRSADEPMTVFLTCLNCQNKWKM